jgi:hypothetical protein
MNRACTQRGWIFAACLPLLTRRHLEAHSLVFLQRFETTALDLGKIREQVFSAAARWDKPKPGASLNHFTVPVCTI